MASSSSSAWQKARKEAVICPRGGRRGLLISLLSSLALERPSLSSKKNPSQPRPLLFFPTTHTRNNDRRSTPTRARSRSGCSTPAEGSCNRGPRRSRPQPQPRRREGEEEGREQQERRRHPSLLLCLTSRRPGASPITNSSSSSSSGTRCSRGSSSSSRCSSSSSRCRCSRCREWEAARGSSRARAQQRLRRGRRRCGRRPPPPPPPPPRPPPRPPPPPQEEGWASSWRTARPSC